MGKSKEIATVTTVFMYRINVAVASVLIFINIQMFIYSIVAADAATRDSTTSGIVLFLAILYGAWGFNGMGQKYIVYADALEYRSLFKRWYLMTGDIDRVTFNRKDDTRLRITLDVKGGKQIVINTGSFKNHKPLIDFCAKLERR